MFRRVEACKKPTILPQRIGLSTIFIIPSNSFSKKGLPPRLWSSCWISLCRTLRKSLVYWRLPSSSRSCTNRRCSATLRVRLRKIPKRIEKSSCYSVNLNRNLNSPKISLFCLTLMACTIGKLNFPSMISSHKLFPSEYSLTIESL